MSGARTPGLEAGRTARRYLGVPYRPARERPRRLGRLGAGVYHGSPASDTEYVTTFRLFPSSVDRFWAAGDARVLILGHTHIPMIGRGPCGTVINPGSVLGVPGVQTSYSFAVVDPEILAFRLFDIRTGREIRRDPVFHSEE